MMERHRPGAQTGRRGGAGPAGGLLGGKDPTGRFFFRVRSQRSGVSHESTVGVCWHPDSCYNSLRAIRISRRELVMAITVEAVYENGTLKLKEPLPFKEHETVRVTVEPARTWAERTAGMLPWTGDPEILHQIATDPEYGILESP